MIFWCVCCHGLDLHNFMAILMRKGAWFADTIFLLPKKLLSGIFFHPMGMGISYFLVLITNKKRIVPPKNSIEHGHLSANCLAEKWWIHKDTVSHDAGDPAIRQAEATAFDWLMHCLALTWKIIFLIVTSSKTLAEREGGHSFVWGFWSQKPGIQPPDPKRFVNALPVEAMGLTDPSFQRRHL